MRCSPTETTMPTSRREKTVAAALTTQLIFGSIASHATAIDRDFAGAPVNQ